MTIIENIIINFYFIFSIIPLFFEPLILISSTKTTKNNAF